MSHTFMLAQQAPPPAGSNGQQQQQGTATTQQPADGEALPGQAQPQGFPTFFYFIIILFIGMILMQIFAGRKEKKRREAMLGGLKRHDRVQTVGGMIGTIAEIREGEVVLKVDESNNTKIRMSRSSVQQVLKSASGGGEESAPVDVEADKVGV